MSAEKKQQAGVLGLIIALVITLFGGLIFMGAVSGWFDGSKVALDAEYLCEDDCDGEYLELSKENYEKLIADKKSFIIFLDQRGCETADTLRSFVMDFARSKGIKVYKMMFEDEKETSLHDAIKYYPSVVMISKGKVVGYLRADSDEDAPAYNNYEDFEKWIRRYL